LNHPDKHLIFDFGNVLIRIDPALSRHAFERLGAPAQLYDELELKDLFERADLGQISETELIEALKAYLPKRISRRRIQEALNALLLDIPESTLDLLTGLSKNYRLHLLSNTCEGHIKSIRKNHSIFFWKRFSSQFEHIWLSYELGKRKPDPSLFERVLEHIEAPAEHCLLVDDLSINRRAAEAAGMKSLHFSLAEGGDHRALFEELRKF
jgi:putative hydrolase of the HAD superfamily